MATAAAALAALTALAAGCSGAPDPRHHRGLPPVSAAAYWNRIRLLGALPLTDGGKRLPLPGESADSRPAAAGKSLRVGALFVHAASGNHFCTASVVSSPGKDLLITAAHCINGGNGAGYRSDIVFIPAYRDGQAPFGEWTVARLLVAPQWAKSADPDYDVGFVVLNSRDGQNIEDVLGADQLGTDHQAAYLVHVTGYPDSDDSPITCVNWTSEQSDSQLRFECSGYSGGTSGSPWVTRFSPRSRTGTIVGVIGGYEQGGDSPSVSYSVRFGTAVRTLYDQAAGITTADQG
ncbi:MAG TPA: trypsin-like serine protease [Streptosporangiaceae bacterium]|jgi:V8-like Glu-specific endopeptidase|nr:trypsin-like serine protease [Streptosporangiaceae bacterium]